MKKINIKKIFLYISLNPYIYVLIMCTYYAIFGYSFGWTHWPTRYGLSAVWCYIDEFWFETVCSFDYRLFLIVLCIIYQIYYAITHKEYKQKVKLDNENEYYSTKKKVNIKKIFYIISITCWIIYFLWGIYAFFCGYDSGWFNSAREYGIEGLKSALFWNLLSFSYIPVLPITLIYIIIYSITNYKRKN